MSAKDFRFDDEARNKILKGIDYVDRCVGSSMGPRGKNTMYRRSNGSVAITKDGVSIAKSIELKDKFEDMAARLIRNASDKSCQETGDGTSATVVLASRMIKEGCRLISAGHSPRDIVNGINYAVNKVVEEIKANSKPIESLDDIENVAKISANGDTEISGMLRQAFDKVGNSGVITVEAGKGIATTLDVVNGYRFDRGYLSANFINNERAECILEDVRILLTDMEINNVNTIIPIMEKCAKTYPNSPLLVVGNCVGDALATMCLNHLKNSFRSCAVKPAGYGQRRTEMLEDLAVLTGATFITESLGLKLEQFDTSWLGGANKVITTVNSTTILNGMGSEQDVENRVSLIRGQIASCVDEFDKKQQEERLAKLVGGIALISVGGHSEEEVKEKVDRWSDAHGATKAASEEGISVGGGKALINCLKVLNNPPDEFKYGVEIVKRAIQEPLRKIAANAGKEEVEVLITSMGNSNPNFGYNAQSEKFEDLMENGVIDPTKVIRCSLLNATSVANLILTTNSMIVDLEDEKKNK